MSSVARVGWALGVGDGLRLARRAVLAFWLYSATGTLLLLGAALLDRGSSKEAGEMTVAFGMALAGLAAGQLAALLRLRISTFVVLWHLAFFAGMLVLGAANAPGAVAAAFAFLTFGGLSGFFSLQHRFELVACFWGTVGWIGTIMVILNAHGRVARWRESKAAAWLPGTLLLLAGFLATLLLYLVAKHGYRLALWQATAAPAPPPGRVAAPREPLLSRRNLLPLLGLAVLLFAFTATVSPFLWRTGEGTSGGGSGGGQTAGAPDDLGEALGRAAEQLRRAVARSVPWLLVLLASLLLDRPIRRLVWVHRLRRPLERVAPTRRVEQLWRYVLVAAGDAGLAPGPADSVREAVARIERAGRLTPEVAAAAEIYERARFGLGLPGGDAARMVPLADAAFRQLRAGLGPWQRLRSSYRRMS